MATDWKKWLCRWWTCAISFSPVHGLLNGNARRRAWSVWSWIETAFLRSPWRRSGPWSRSRGRRTCWDRSTTTRISEGLQYGEFHRLFRSVVCLENGFLAGRSFASKRTPFLPSRQRFLFGDVPLSVEAMPAAASISERWGSEEGVCCSETESWCKLHSRTPFQETQNGIRHSCSTHHKEIVR